MKKLLFAAGLFFALQFSYAQDETRIGAMLAYGTEIESLGIGANAEFPIMENLTLAPSFIYYFPKEEFGVKVAWFEFNADGHYYFVNEDSIGAYGLAGLSYNSVKVTVTDNFFGNYSASDSRLGLNIGGGANFHLGGSITPFAELKYVIIDGGQVVIGAGVRFAL